MIKEMLIIMLLIAPAAAWEIQNGTVQNMTESDLVYLITTVESAGHADCHEVFVKSAYSTGKIDYSDLWKFTNNNNALIRAYNLVIEEHFNAAVISKLRLSEYSV